MKSDGWYDLPGGGNVEINNGYPIHVGDRGRWTLDESQILLEAATASDMKLTWANLDRSKRWRRLSLIKVLTGSEYSQACIAAVLRAGCDRCGSDVGIRWIRRPSENTPIWCCQKCALPEETSAPLGN
jgi:hypothetical protein